MIRILFLCLALVALATPVRAVELTVPFPRTVVAGAQYGLAVASSTGLTVPPGATVAQVTVEGTSIRYTTDGATTPTATVGMGPFPAGTTLLFNITALAALRIIQTSASATIDVEYFQ